MNVMNQCALTFPASTTTNKGTISPLNGVMKAYVVDNFKPQFTVSAFAKLVSIYAGAGVLCAIVIYVIIGGEVRSFFFDHDIHSQLTTEYVMYSTIGLYLITFLLFAALVPESLSRDHKMSYLSPNPCHGIKTALCRNGILLSATMCTFCVTFAQTGVAVLAEELFLSEWSEYDPDSDDDDLFLNLLTITDHQWNRSWTVDDVFNILSDDLVVYALFLLSTGMTLICVPCCIHIFCGKAMVNMVCSLMLMVVSCGMIVAVMMFSEWYIAIVALLCGVLFGFGEIAMVFLNGRISGYVFSRQFGISYGILHGAYSLARGVAPYSFYLLFEISYPDKIGTVELNEAILGNGNAVLIVAVLATLVGVVVALWTRRKMRIYEDDKHDSEWMSMERKRSEAENGKIEMQPVPPGPGPGPGAELGPGTPRQAVGPMNGDSLDLDEAAEGAGSAHGGYDGGYHGPNGHGQPPPPSGDPLYPVPASSIHSAFQESHSDQLYDLSGDPQPYQIQAAFAPQVPARPNLDYQPGSQHGSYIEAKSHSSAPRRPFGGRLPSEPGSSHYGSERDIL